MNKKIETKEELFIKGARLLHESAGILEGLSLFIGEPDKERSRLCIERGLMQEVIFQVDMLSQVVTRIKKDAILEETYSKDAWKMIDQATDKPYNKGFRQVERVHRMEE